MADGAGASRVPVELTSYVGRLEEAARAKRMLDSGHLLTLSGTGGVGKTRLAGRVAADVDQLFQGDVVFARLAELRDAELLPDLVADALGLRDQSGRTSTSVVIEHLRNRRMLLLLDNCEHLVEACAKFVTAVLRECPHVSILVTSRQSIGVSGEQILPVPPLATPVADDVRSPADLEKFDSVRLFVDRARSVVPTFEVTDDNFADVARLCQDLEGLPLAIELAAVRVRSLSVRQLTERLTDRLALLTKGRRTAPRRQQTLRATIDWSYGLCSAPEQLMWSRAAVFSGTFGLAAAEHVCGGAGVDPDDVLNLVDGLLDKSILVREEQGGEVRYRMLETLREYGLDRLDEAADRQRVSERHRDWYAGLADRFERAWIGPDQVPLMAALRREYPNIRVALDFCFTAPGEAAAGVRMIAKIIDFWSVSGLFTELRVWMDRAMATLPDDAPERVTALRIDGWTALFQGDAKSVVDRFGTAGELLARRPDEVEAAYVAAGWGVTAVFSGDPAAAVPLTKTAWDGFRAHGVRRGESFVPTPYGLSVGLTEDYQRGRAVLQEIIARCAELGETHWRSWALCCLGFLDMKAVRDADLADTIGRQALRMAHEVGTVEVEAFTTETLAAVAAHKGEHVRAATLLGIAETGWTAMGTTPAAYVPLFELREEYAAHTREALGDTAFERAVALGRALPPEAGLRYTLNETEPAAAPAPDSGLTKRQTQIAELVAEGLTSKEIAHRLVISQRTVESHVDSIRTRLGFHTRSEIAAWVARRDH
ncbi:non-specific serine/threonine protein kinase [Actinokineospora alba]|uniref:Non-specific serine/threonine protein kinase n=1 Tax=Actinokineospora alba TaxID=504798 RepID=A0A1H0TSK0_9PSEU|nr:LuxR C-terminal-related transcriptional regulator [Actinokineospora alba]TDP70692.1 non-specific serine/threonine protein kinase [Actinokineospora alba]SDJ13893.1 non-specific serine/threonine protein kinase [Actinokineospora alba]SDP56997.1 non-specific serine/threonine protein kinase [Actinokineospora alba]